MMHYPTANMRIAGMSEKAPYWQNLNQFSLNENQGPQVIVVGLYSNKDASELLSWVTKVVAQPDDSIIVLCIHPDAAAQGNTGALLQKNHGPEVLNACFKSHKDLCNAKKVQLCMKCKVEEKEGKAIIEEASIARATFLIVSTSNCHPLQRSLLIPKVPDGCSIIIVKNDSFILYKNHDSRAEMNETDSLLNKDVSQASPKQAPKGLSYKLASFCKMIFGTLSPEREMEVICDVSSNKATSNKVWPDQMENYSPRGVLEGPEISSELNGSYFSNGSDGLLDSASKEALLPNTPFKDIDSTNETYPQSCLSLQKKASMRRFPSFPPTNRLRKFSSFRHRSMGHSSKFYTDSSMNADASNQELTGSSSDISDNEHSWSCFAYEELVLATNDFHPDNIVGKGGYAEVYKGSFLDGRLIAVKRLTRVETKDQKERDFLTELGIISHVSHPNTTPLIGFCIEKGLYFIFNLSEHGSLASFLHGREFPVLDWVVRYKIALGIAHGLEYLHRRCQRRIIHRDIKASNILLGSDFTPQISDFGLAKWLPKEWTHLTLTPIEGTFGYLAPEYFMHGIVNEKTDVFAFGVLLLELVTGRQPINESQQSLVIWARPLIESMKISDLADPRLNGIYDTQEMQNIVMTAGFCIHHSVACRPSMDQVLQLLTHGGSSLDRLDVWSSSSSQSDYFEDSSMVEEYTCTKYLKDLSRHREIALQF